MVAKGLNPIHHRCGTCGEIFLSLAELCAHAQAHSHAGRYPAQRETVWELRLAGSHSLKHLAYACRVCGAIFASGKELGAHAQAHVVPDRMER